MPNAERMRRALDQILNGSILDECNNHNDDGLLHFGMWREPTLNDVQNWRALAIEGLKEDDDEQS